jgi:hypothetical protein
LELEQNLIIRPASYGEQARQLVAAMPWRAAREDPRRISYLDLALMALFLVLFWWLF